MYVARKKVRQLIRRGAYFWLDENSHHIKMLRKTKVFCSAACCGNPRRHKIKTYKDKLEKELLEFEKKELESMETDDHFEAFRIGETEFYGD